ncbi:hypothetical protein MPTK1_8g10730 [Marchantia polymorpha subsp. ruderalis]|uniref:Uncharacterized protein n=1 Tax=Marchantia polymorpha TaxID=3197 RepID=A0A2R6XMP6_MARPO|nr:hypothetical protein MARPO_0008s0150 [Marchantia polymorpha]BBN19444.1 hypothetical protein Mp_8g10730 [Marchantia polymorpha subsp. ruderalis]|eukprot:PTQ47388.1 hypothetical protein MARPO_0008s0150 [Marchantia polymorpha]
MILHPPVLLPFFRYFLCPPRSSLHLYRVFFLPIKRRFPAHFSYLHIGNRSFELLANYNTFLWVTAVLEDTFSVLREGNFTVT